MKTIILSQIFCILRCRNKKVYIFINTENVKMIFLIISVRARKQIRRRLR